MENPTDKDAFIEEDDTGLEAGTKALEEKWFNQAVQLRSHLISPVHDAGAKGNVERLRGLPFHTNFSLLSR